MKNKHTCGPWSLSDGGGINAKWDNGQEVQVCLMGTTCWFGTEAENGYNKRMREEHIYNANLIAAAPELLGALEIAVGYMNNDNEDKKIVLAAIKKARGE